MSTALTNWRSERAEHIDELVDAHERLGGSGPGRRWGTEPINWALTVRLVAQFQGFARDLHDEAVEHVVATVRSTSDPAATLLNTFLRQNRGLDRGNPDQNVLQADFSRFGIEDFWGAMDEVDARTPRRRTRLEQVVRARNGIAHDDRSKLESLRAEGLPLTLRTITRWRRSLNGLALTLDKCVARHLASAFDAARPW